ncbi:hypothetical protein [Wenyingzhuangia sp. IMCC45574]
MKKLTYNQYFDLIQKAKDTSPYLYVSTFKDAKENLVPEHFNLLQQRIAKVA